MTFESLTLTPFCMEILGVKKMDISMFLAVFSVRFWFEPYKMCKNKSTFIIFTIICRYTLLFFSPGRDQPLGRAGLENIGPRISPLHEFWIRAGQLYLNWLIRLGQKSSIKGNTSISI